ncbi:MAG: glycoside hydrolase family 9 protein [Verrucomicrobiota bacterium]
MGGISAIPADPALEADLVIHECQAGYAAGGAKFAVVSCGPPAAHGNFEIQEPGTHHTQFAGSLTYAGQQWGRHCWLADFSGFQKPGKWRLWAHTGSGHEAAVEIGIRPDLHAELAEKAAKHFHRKRCGVLCHTHDGVIRSTRQKDFGKAVKNVDVTGGWHDAHDDNKWIFMAWSGVDALCEAWETLRPGWSGANEPLPFLLAEAWWEVEWFLKMQKEDGSFYYAVLDWKKRRDSVSGRWLMSPWAYNGFHTYDVLTEDARWLLDEWRPGGVNRLMGLKSLCPSTPEMYFAQTAACMAKFASQVAPFNGELARRVTAAVRRTLTWLAKRTPRPTQRIYTEAAIAQTHLDLHKVQKNGGHLREAEKGLRGVLALQTPEGWFRAAPNFVCLEADPSKTDDRILIDTPFAYVIPLLRYLRDHPRGELAKETRSSLGRFFQGLKAQIRTSGAYGQMTQYRTDVGKPAALPPEAPGGLNAWFLAVGYLCALGASILKDTELRTIAERQVQWVLGVNPFAMSYMAGVGRRHSTKKPLFVHEDDRDVLWGIATGILCGGGADYGAAGTANAIRGGLSEIGGYDAACEETWLNTTAWFLSVTSLLAQGGGHQTGMAR